MPKCNLKPGSRFCIEIINKAINSTGCHGCPAINNGGETCISNAKTPIPKKKSADKAVKAAPKN